MFQQLRTVLIEAWIEHRTLAYVLARVVIAFLAGYMFFVVGGAWAYLSGCGLVALAVWLTRRARKW